MGSDQQFCLRWNNHQGNMVNVFDSLLKDNLLVDVTLACEGSTIKAHKVVLSACSTFFQDIFVNNPCTHPVIVMNGMKYSEMNALLQFMYKGEVNVSQDQLAALLRTAESLKVKGLAEVDQNQHQQENDAVAPKQQTQPAAFSATRYDSGVGGAQSTSSYDQRQTSTASSTPSSSYNQRQTLNVQSSTTGSPAPFIRRRRMRRRSDSPPQVIVS